MDTLLKNTFTQRDTEFINLLNNNNDNFIIEFKSLEKDLKKIFDYKGKETIPITSTDIRKTTKYLVELYDKNEIPENILKEFLKVLLYRLLLEETDSLTKKTTSHISKYTNKFFQNLAYGRR